MFLLAGVFDNFPRYLIFKWQRMAASLLLCICLLAVTTAAKSSSSFPCQVCCAFCGELYWAATSSPADGAYPPVILNATERTAIHYRWDPKHEYLLPEKKNVGYGREAEIRSLLTAMSNSYKISQTVLPSLVLLAHKYAIEEPNRIFCRQVLCVDEKHLCIPVADSTNVLYGAMRLDYDNSRLFSLTATAVEPNAKASVQTKRDSEDERRARDLLPGGSMHEEL